MNHAHAAPPITTTVDSMAISVVGLFLLFCLLGGLVLVAALLANRRTRPFAMTFLGLLGVFALVMFGVLFTVRVVSHSSHHAVETYDWISNHTHLRHPAPPMPPIPVEGMEALPSPLIDLADAESGGEEAAAAEASSESPEAPQDEDENGDDAIDAPEEKKSETASESPAVEAKDEPVKPEPTAPVKAPDWVNAAPSTVGEVYRQVIAAGPWSEVEDCNRGTVARCHEAIQKYLEEIAGEELRVASVYLPSLAEMGISMNWIRQNVVCSDPQPFLLTADSSVGPMKTLYTQLEIDRNDREFMRTRWLEYMRGDRIKAVTAVGSFLLLSVGLLFGLLKIDTWTKGFYTKRLLIGVPAAIIGGMLLLLTWKEVIF